MTALRLPVALVGAVAACALAVAGLAASSPAAGPSLRPTVTWSDAAPVIAGTSTTSTTSLYRFSSFVGGKPVRWNPCASIHWRFRTTGAPAGALTMVKSAVATIQSATAVRWVYDGPTTATPTSAWLPKTSTGIRPVLIGWTDGSHSDLLHNQPAAVLGMTRTAYFGVTLNGVQIAATKAAVIALDRTNRLPLTGGLSWKTTLLHELSHAVGLAHVSNSHELMYPVLQRNLYGLQSGDKAGLIRLGRSAGCINLGF